MDFDDSDDPRDVELTSLNAIYPEIQQVHPGDHYTIALDVPVTPSKAVIVSFPAAAAEPTQPVQPNGNLGHAAEGGPNLVDQQELAHLPPLHLEIVFGPGYPAEKPPKVTISTTPPWLPLDTIQKLQDDAPRLWEELGRDMVGFTYIDYVQQAAEEVFGLVDDAGTLALDAQHKISILDYDIQARRAAFERETFDCGVCLDPKKGSACHKMMDCGHVFCVQCLQDFYNDAIEKGELASVRCLTPGCAKDREKAAAAAAAQAGGGKKRKKVRTYISPSELLQIPLDQEKVKRYVTLKYKTELESDKNTIYCPRQWCNGAARSKKHKKPQGLELGEVSDDEDDKEEDKLGEDRLAICEECSYAFCSRCLLSWHGEFVRCRTRGDAEKLTEEEKASIEYMRLHTTPCPTCNAPAQKTQGCNHMICGRCQTHFCYLCSAWLDPGNPYQHFNEQPGGRVTSCYMRLWELENGDGDDVGIGFAGGRQPAARPLAQQVNVPMVWEPEDAHVVGDRPNPPAQAQEGQPPAGAPRPAEVAREGPLVLRIGGGNPPAGGGRGGPRGGAGNAPAPRQVAAGGRGQNNNPDAQPRGGGRGRGRGGGQEQQRGPRGGGGGAVAQRGQGRGGRGQGRGGGRAAQAPAGQQRRNNNNQNQNNNNNEQLAREVQDLEALGHVDHDEQGGEEALNAAQEAWIRQFVQLAMEDHEELMLDEIDDSDDDEDLDHNLVLFD